MKKVLSFASFVMMFLLVSCNETNQGIIAYEGKPTELSVGLNAVGFSPTRASETGIDKLYLYVFSDDNKKSCEKIYDFQGGWSDAKLTANGSDREFKFITPSGGKYLLASANTELKFKADSAIVVGTPLQKVLDYEASVSGSGENATSLSTSFPMISYKYYYVTGGETKLSQKPEFVSLSMERLWSKVEAISSSTFISTFKTIANLTADPTITYTVRNISKAYKYTNTSIADPVEANETKTADHTPIYPVLSSDNLNKYWSGFSGDYKTVGSTNFSNTDSTRVCYIPENQVKLSSIANTPTMNSVTYALICIQVAPNQVHNGTKLENYTTGGDAVLAYKDGAVYKDNNKVVWFKDPAAARKVVAGCVPRVYANGKLYYRINLQDASRKNIENKAYSTVTAASSVLQQYNVIRNSFYKITLSSVKTFDESLPGVSPVDMDGVDNQPVGTSAITAFVTVEPWKEININSTL